MKQRKPIVQIIISILLALLFLAPLYILVVNSFKTQKGIFSNVLALPNSDSFTLSSVGRVSNPFGAEMAQPLLSPAIIRIYTSKYSYCIF